MIGKFFCDLFALIFGRKKISDDYESYSLEDQKKSHTIHMEDNPTSTVYSDTEEVKAFNEVRWSEPNTYVFPVKENE